MAEKLNFSRSLFMHEDGRPISFCMRPCMERKTLKPLIEAGGGTISYRETKDCVKLLEPGSLAKSSDEFIKSQFVLDCAKVNRLLDMSAYRCTSSSSPQQSSEDGMEPAPHIIKTTAAATKGRQKYSPIEDQHIVKYLIKEHRYTEVHGKKLWNDMALFQVTNHPAESMRTHYLKYILPNIHSYGFPPQWVSMVTGNTAHSASDKSDKTSLSTTCDTVQELASVPDADLEEENSQSILRPQFHQHSSPRKSHQHCSPRKSHQHSSPGKSHQHSSPGKSHQHNSPRKSHQHSSPGKSHQHNSPGKSHQHSSPGKSHQPSSPGNSQSSNQTPQKQIRSVLTSSSNLNGSLDVDITSESEDEFDKILIQTANGKVTNGVLEVMLKPAQKQTSLNTTVSSPGSHSPNKRSGKDEDSVEETQAQKQTSTPESDSPSNRSRKDENSSKETRAQKQKSAKTIKLSGSNSSSNKRCGKESGRTSADSCSSTPDSYDRQLIECGRQFEKQLRQAFVVLEPLRDSSPGSRSGKRNRASSPSPLQVNSSSRDSSVTSSAKRKTHSPPGEEKPKKKKLAHSLLSYVMEDSETDSQLSVSQGSSLLEPVLEETDSETEVTTEEIQTAANRFGLTLQEMVHVLYINSGSLDDAIHWLMFGWDMEGYPAWSKLDDEILQGTDEDDYLAVEMKHGCKRVKVRREFLEWIVV